VGEWGAVGGKMERRAGGINLLADFIPCHLRLITSVVRLFPASVPRHVHAFAHMHRPVRFI